MPIPAFGIFEAGFGIYFFPYTYHIFYISCTFGRARLFSKILNISAPEKCQQLLGFAAVGTVAADESLHLKAFNPGGFIGV
jgi:hypothetical protein